MASAPGSGKEMFARVDAAGRLTDADPVIEALQLEAGSALGDKLVLPQLAAVARIVRKLGIGVTRPAVVASTDYDLELWVRGEPEGDDVVLRVENWKRRPPPGPRLEVVASAEEFKNLPGARDDWETDCELRLLSVSGQFAEHAGIDMGKVSGLPLTRLLRLEEAEDGSMPLLAALGGRTSFTGQIAQTRSSPARRMVLSGEPVTDGEGGITGFKGRAVFEIKSTPMPANEAGSSLFAIDPSLDQALRSPLDRIIAAAEGIVQRSEGPLRSDYAEYAGDIAAAAKHLLSVIRFMAHQPPQTADILDLGELAAEAVNLIEPQADERSISITMDSVEGLAAQGEARGTIQILVNLLGNAVRHSPSEGVVRVEFGSHAGMAQVTISDEGEGIDLLDQERIFEKFERAGESTGGAGLGLAIARRLARSMQGEITLQSAPGQGARFTLSLPAA